MLVFESPRGEGLRPRFLPAQNDLRPGADSLVLICVICSKKLSSTDKDKARIGDVMT